MMHKGSERDSQITHKIMSSIPSKDTKPELLLRKALWNQKLRYRVNYKKLQGKPDIVFTKYQIAVFCDGDFWHGHNWKIRGLSSLEEELNGYSEFWRKKIQRNVERDNEINCQLHSLGWTVVRFWESEIYADLDGCVKTIQEAIFEAKMNMDE
jgi:DNA mismatch endonuclease (patch repair protein)